MTDLEDIRELLLERLALAGVDDIRETEKGGRGSCPHCNKPDRFIIGERSDGDGYYVKCYAHCLQRDVLDVLELSWRDLRLSAREGKPHVTELRNPDLTLARAVRWAWRQRIPIGKLSLNVGNEGVGKGAVTAYLCARWSKGDLTGDLYGTPAHVLVVGDEDTVNDTWTPRLYLAGADFTRVHFQVEADGHIDLTEEADVEHLRALIRLAGVQVVVFDALLDHIGGAGVDEFKPKAVRGALRPLRWLAAEEEVAVLGTLHPRKGRVLSYRDLVANSHQFNAVSRSSLLLAQHPENPELRVLAWGKGNHAGLVPTLEFRIEPVTFELHGREFTDVRAVDWEESEITLEGAIQASSGGPGRPRHEEKRYAVLGVLTDKPQTVRAIAAKAQIARSTTQDILHELAELEEARLVEGGWVLGTKADVSEKGEENRTGQKKPLWNKGFGRPVRNASPFSDTLSDNGVGEIDDAQGLLQDLEELGL